MHRKSLAGFIALMVLTFLTLNGSALAAGSGGFFISLPTKYIPYNISCDNDPFETHKTGGATPQCPLDTQNVNIRTRNGQANQCHKCTIDIATQSLIDCASPGIEIPAHPTTATTISFSAATTFTAGSSVASSLCDAIAPPPKSKIDLGITPVSINVSSGANAMPYELDYYVVSLTPKSSTPFSLYFDSLPPGLTFKENGGTSTCHSGGTFTPSTATNSPTNFTLPKKKGSSCNIHLTVIATAPESLDSGSLTANFVSNRATTPAATNVYWASGEAMQSAARTITFTNQCDYAVYLGIHGAAAQTKNPQSGQPCSLDIDDCVNGSSCVNTGTQRSPVNSCFWDNPEPANGGSYKLVKHQTPTTVTFPVYNNGARQYVPKSSLFNNQETVWSGTLSGRLAECSDGSCEVYVNGCDGVDNGVVGACKPSQGFGATPGPTSQLEPTFLKSAPVVYSTATTDTLTDTYDLTLINGVTVPMSMKPSNASWGGSAHPYICTHIGSGTALTHGENTVFGECDWYGTPAFNTTTLPISDYLWVEYDEHAKGCGAHGTCTDGGQCGLMIEKSNNNISQKCGTPVGQQAMYWTDDQICVEDSNYGTCSSELGTDNAKFSEMLGCTGDPYKNSCYTTTDEECCGCVDWQTYASGTVPSSTTSCADTGSVNAKWTSEVLPKIAWIKKHCPTAYSYPFDDKSSGVACSNITSYTHPSNGSTESINVVDYDVVFCP